jgi:hypothetical protein
MVLTDAEDVEADLVGQLDLLEEVVQPLCRGDLRTDVGEGVETEFHRRFLSSPFATDVRVRFEPLEEAGP